MRNEKGQYTKGFNNQLGRKRSPESRLKMRLAKLGKCGELANNWQGGLTPKNVIGRNSEQYREWRTHVFARDGYTCTWCRDNSGGNLEADHIKTWALYPDLRFVISNGRTMCRKCHRLLHRFKIDLSYSDIITTI